jgi:hypothetical protein
MGKESILNKSWIDGASYKELLHRWRHAPTGDPMFQGETGGYYANVMREKRAQMSDAQAAGASKKVGWCHDLRIQEFPE